MKKNYDCILGALFGLLTLNLYYFSGLVIEHKVVPKSVDFLIGFFNSATGAMAGALLAFLLHDRQEKKKIDKVRIENLQSALLLLAVKLNQLRHIKYNLLEPHKNKPNWWCSVVSYSEFEIKKSFTLSDLSFIQSSMHKFLLELSIADEAYSGTVSYFNERSRLHRDKLQPAQKAILEKTPHVNCSTIHMFLDEPLIQEMNVATNGVYNQCGVAIKNLEKLQQQLFEYCCSSYPNEKFLDHDQIFNEQPHA